MFSKVQTVEYELPEYLVFDVHNPIDTILHTKSAELIFPLSEQDLIDIYILEKKFDQEENCAGLAAPQIGISKKFFIMAAEENEELRKWRPDFTEYLPKTLFINPTYTGIEEMGKHEDYEGCFSVKDVTGPVLRYNKISYSMYDIDGKFITGTAEGFLARIIQHETDHVNGVLCIDLIDPDKIVTREEYRAKRKAAMEA